MKRKLIIVLLPPKNVVRDSEILSQFNSSKINDSSQKKEGFKMENSFFSY